MMRPPTIVIASLSAIAVTGSFFFLTSLTSDVRAVSVLFLSLPLAAAACYRVMRHARTVLFVTALAAMAPVMVGLMLTWPNLLSSLPYIAGIAAIFGGLSGMLSPLARSWHASANAHRLLDP
jgi:ABC-type siderophore export system fused ATPase/permease subunit